nr:NADH dehydrogenase subunit 2 [Carcinus maenas]
MTFPISYLFFFFCLTLGSFLSISSSSWFGAWLGLELNLLSFIPLITLKMTSYLSEAAIKYFLIQAMASTILIMSSTLFMMNPDYSYSLILLSLILKLGAAPFHFWFPQVMEGLLWPQTVVLLTIQKLAPMFLISYLCFNSYLTTIIMVSSMMSAIVGAVGGLNVMKLRKVMAFSSINHMAWMLIAISLNDILWSTYFVLYSMISISVVTLFNFTRSYVISDLTNNLESTSLSGLVIPMSLFSLGGLPPFTGFVPKWLMIQLLVANKLMIPLTVLLASSLITLYFYLRIMIPMILLTFPSLMLSLNKGVQFYFKAPYLTLPSFFNLFGIFLPLPFCS